MPRSPVVPIAVPVATGMKVLGIGNPLLDMVVDVPLSFFTKYNVKLNNSILAEEKHMPIYEELAKLEKVKYVPGGATQNTIRICQALLKIPQITGYTGCIGKDKNGTEMKKLLQDEGIIGLYEESKTNPTGICGVLVNGGERSLVTYLGAANDYTLDHLRFKVWESMEEAQILYSSSFFLTVCPQASQTVGEHCTKTNKLFCINLAAPFIAEFFMEPLMQVLPFADYVFGNESEFLQFAKGQGYDTCNLDEIAGKVAMLPKVNVKRQRVVVVTQGSDPTIVATTWMGAGVKIQKFTVEPLEKSKLIDTNGAGDAFAGGFLYGLAKNKDLDFCVYAGTYAARHVIQNSGCTFDFKDLPLILRAEKEQQEQD